jgi:hypothetical protein
MKTTKILAAISIALFLLIANASYAAQNKIIDPQNDQIRYISYVVQISNSYNLKPGNAIYQIVITDETGRIVATPQTFRAGIWTYRFTELGDVRGTRIAKMIQQNDPDQPTWNVSPVSKTGVFLGGHSYLFRLIPRCIAVPVGNDKY